MQQPREWHESMVQPNSSLNSNKTKGLRIITLFIERQEAESVVSKLISANFPREEASTIAEDPPFSQDLDRFGAHKQVRNQAGQSTRVVIPSSYCKRCRFHYGDHGLICALHPYGPDSESCSDYAPKGGFLNSTDRDGWNIDRFQNWKR